MKQVVERFLSLYDVCPAFSQLQNGEVRQYEWRLQHHRIGSHILEHYKVAQTQLTVVATIQIVRLNAGEPREIKVGVFAGGQRLVVHHGEGRILLVECRVDIVDASHQRGYLLAPYVLDAFHTGCESHGIAYERTSRLNEQLGLMLAPAEMLGYGGRGFLGIYGI